MTTPNLTQTEQDVLNDLANAWNRFCTLRDSFPADVDEFQRAIHQAQAIVALRVARRVDTNIWRQPK